MKEFNVPFTVKMKARIRLEDGESLEDAISDIDIPENHQCFYVQDSFEPGTPEEQPLVNKPSTNLFRTIIVVEVLSEGRFNNINLSEIGYAIMEGDCSGQVNISKFEELTRDEMAKALEAQGSDPSFLLGEDDVGEDELHLDSDGCLKNNDGDAETDMEDRNNEVD